MHTNFELEHSKFQLKVVTTMSDLSSPEKLNPFLSQFIPDVYN